MKEDFLPILRMDKPEASFANDLFYASLHR
jgi:hypothetical protein